MSKDQDHYLEEFWKDFKNLLRKLEREFPVIKNYVNINEMSGNLNYLKTESRFVEIENAIEKYMIDIGWTMIKNYENYYFNLYNTQLKKWRKIPSILTNKLIEHNFKHFNDNIFNLYLSLVSNINISDNPKYKLLFSQIHIPDYDDENDVMKSDEYNKKRVEEILPILIEEKKGGTISIITRYLDISRKMMELYGVNIPPRMDGRKVLNVIEKISQK